MTIPRETIFYYHSQVFYSLHLGFYSVFINTIKIPMGLRVFALQRMLLNRIVVELKRENKCRNSLKKCAEILIKSKNLDLWLCI